MKTMLRNVVRFALPAVAIVILGGCKTQPMQPADVSALFTRWFVEPHTLRLDTLLRENLSCDQYQSITAGIGSGAGEQPGKQSVVLSDTAGAPFTLGYRTPAVMRQDTTYPLIIWLHGGIGTSVTTKGESAYEMLSPLADTFQLFLASPSANRTTPWWSPAGLARIQQTVRYLATRYPINPDKVFLAGVSDGATGCYAVANCMGTPFAGFIAISGFGGMLPQMGMTLYAANLTQRPIHNINAGKDHLYPAKTINAFLDDLVKQGVNITRKLYPLERHGFDYRNREFGTIAQLIRTWSKPAPGNGFAWTMVHGVPNLPSEIIEMKPSARPIGAPFISGFWNNDTLMVQAVSVGGFTIGRGQKGGAVPWVRVNNGKAYRMTPASDEARLLLGAARQSLFPHVRCQALYQIPISDQE